MTPIVKEVVRRVKEHAGLTEGAEIAAAADGVSARLKLRQAESLGCLLDEVEVADETAASSDVVGCAKQLAGKINYLLEPIGLIEFDRHTQTALLRSNPPRVEDDQTLYYELLLRAGQQATLKRYTVRSRGPVRESIPFAMTHDQLGLLLDDLTPQRAA